MHALLLDALGTLVELEPPAPRLRAELQNRFGIRVSGTEAERAVAAEIAYYRQHLDEGRDAASLADLRARCAEAVRAALPQMKALAEVSGGELTEALLASLRFRAFPDARPAIASARQRGQRVIVVSNWDISLGEVLERLGLAPLLHGIVTSAIAGARKPSTRIFKHALTVAGVRSDEAVHVGDSFAEDVIGARRAGIEPVLIARDGAPGAPGVRTVASLTELA